MTSTHTVAFIFNKDITQILLILKQRPDWQKGKYNGPGGKIEPNESSRECIVREIAEETALVTEEESWQLFASISEGGRIIDCYVYVYKKDMADILQLTDETVDWIPINSLPSNCIPNLFWLIPMAKNIVEGESIAHCTVVYTS